MVVPESVAIILDGNGRYATKNNIPRALGHKAGCDNLEVILEECVRLHVKFLTVYAFSTENWKRSKEEVEALMKLFDLYMPKILTKALKNNVRINFIGDLEGLNEHLKTLCYDMMNQTKDMSGTVFTIAFNYGSRNEIVRAVKKLISKGINPNEITEDLISSNLDTYNIKDPDLLIRTSGELRLSNFLLWQLSYSEFYITNTLWPEFSVEELHKAFEDYEKRDRRYGGRK